MRRAIRNGSARRLAQDEGLIPIRIGPKGNTLLGGGRAKIGEAREANREMRNGTVMKKLVLAAGVPALMSVLLTPAAAELYPYCAWYTDKSTNCGFPTLWSCQAAVSGVGGYCGVNPRWAALNRPANNGPPPSRGPGRVPPPPRY
jgi:uncharacterized protein DUF3551